MLRSSRFFFLFSCLFLPLISFGQFAAPFSVGVGAGATQVYGDLRNKPFDFAGHVDLDYLLTPYTSVGLQGQMGTLRGDDLAGRHAVNRYTAANANVKVRIGQFMNRGKNFGLQYLSDKSFLSYLSFLYAGAGIGFIYSDVEAYRGGVEPENVPEVFAGEDYSYTTIIPVNVGIDIPFGTSLAGPVWAVNLNFQLGISFGDNIDGYTNSYSNYQDRTTYVSLGIKRAIRSRFR